MTRSRELHREARRRVPYPVVALVGYTNAGKSTLFNNSSIKIKVAIFALSRCVWLYMQFRGVGFELLPAKSIFLEGQVAHV